MVKILNTNTEHKEKFLNLTQFEPVPLNQSKATALPTKLQMETADFINFTICLLQLLLRCVLGFSTFIAVLKAIILECLKLKIN